MSTHIKLNYQTLAEIRRLMLVVQRGIDCGDIGQDPDGYIPGPNFHMAHYLNLHPCGTVACAAGWAEIAGIHRPDGPNYHGSKDLVVMNPDALDSETIDQMFEWIFGGKWAAFGKANRPVDVVRRIDYLVTCDLDDEDDFEFMWDMPPGYCIQEEPGPIPQVLEGWAVKSWTVGDLLSLEVKHREVNRL